MCIAIPGQVKSIKGESSFDRAGKVDFAGLAREVSLAYVPRVQVGDWVLVHAGFAITIVDEQEALNTIDDINAMLGSGD